MKYTAILEDEHIVRIGDKPCLHCFNGRMEDYFIPVKERKAGKWIKVSETEFGVGYQCSECGRFILTESIDGRKLKDFPYCHCGADMRGDEDGK